MDKQLILAVAGAGKTTQILNDISPNRRSLILTHTNQNLFSLEASIRDKYDGIVPNFVEVRTYFSFLHSFCIRPFLSYKLRDNGFVYGPIPKSAQKTRKDTMEHYMTQTGRYLFAARAAKLVKERGMLEKVKDRLSRHFDNLYVDEVQDFSANDFNFLLDLAQADVSALYVGDYFQHTFDTSRDGNTRSTLYTKGAESYAKEFEKAGFEIDTTTLSKTRRCSPIVCSYISDTIDIDISSARSDVTEIIYVENPVDVLAVFQDREIVKLFYNNHAKFDCYSNNWGNSKGLNKYQDVCVVLNKRTNELLNAGRGQDLASATKNKLYVACSRTRGNLYLLEERLLKSVLKDNGIN